MSSRDRSSTLRLRLQEAMATKAISKSALARATLVDRSTIGQLLKGDLPRMPNAQLAADMAAALGVSADWLLGLTNRPELVGDILASAMALSPAERSSADDQIIAWHADTAGAKIRHVPATLPEMMKIEPFLQWEYAESEQSLIRQIGQTASTLFERLKSGEADYEIAMPLYEVEACATGTGYYHGLSQSLRYQQLGFLADQCDLMYPRLRMFLFDARRMFSAPVTVFGNSLAILYVGKFYLSLRERQRVSALTEHFDWLIRGSTIDARDVSGHLRALCR